MISLARHLDPETGDLVFNDATGSWLESPSPAMEVVALVLRTPRGSCPLDPTLGVEWDKVDKILPNATATCRAVILEGLQGLVEDGTIADLSITVDQPSVRALTYVVAFTDPANPGAGVQTVPGQV